MPELGMRMAQRMEQRMEQRLVFHPGDDDIERFHTPGEEYQISQLEVLNQIVKILERGEYYDPIHFDIEINRNIFGHPLEAGLAHFGSDITKIMQSYHASERAAKRLLAALSVDGEKDDLPGKIANSWTTLLTSRHYKKRTQKQTLLNEIEFLKQKTTHLDRALELLTTAADQPTRALLDTTHQRLNNYTETDTRIIPFTSQTAQPFIRAVQTPLTPEQAEALYTECVETLYTLDRELRVPRSVERIAQHIREQGLPALIDSPLPAPIQATISSIGCSPETESQFKKLAATSSFRQGREIKRNIYAALATLDQEPESEQIIEHLLTHTTNVKKLQKILTSLQHVVSDPSFNYPYELDSQDAILRNIQVHLVDKSLSRLNLSPKTLETYLDRHPTDQRIASIGKIFTTLATYSHQEHNIPLMGELLTAELEGTYWKYKFTHDKAKEQLKCIGGKPVTWGDPVRNVRVVGELDALRAHISSIQSMLPKMRQIYTEHYQEDEPDNKDTGEDLKTRIEHITTHLQSGDCTKDEHAALKQETTQLEEQFEYLTLLTNIHSLTPDSYPEALAQAEALARRKSKNPLYHSAKWVADTLNEPVYRSARKIVVEKVTDLETKLRKGEFPIPHCQNWRDNSSLNVSLLSFTADANKNTYHISEYSNGVTRPNTESEVRLVGWQSSPTLLIENIYSSEWNDEYGIALLGTIAQEALNLYTNTKANEVRIAAPLDSGHDGHTTNISVLNAMRTFCKQYGLELQEGYMELSPPESKATKEYYDSGPGIVKSGSDVTLGNVAYITISTEID